MQFSVICFVRIYLLNILQFRVFYLVRDQSSLWQAWVVPSKELTYYRADALFVHDREIWVIEVEAELNYSALGQALSYKYAYSLARLKESRPSPEIEKTSNVRPTIVCYVASKDLVQVCNKNQIQLFYCREGHLSPRKFWPLVE